MRYPPILRAFLGYSDRECARWCEACEQDLVRPSAIQRSINALKVGVARYTLGSLVAFALSAYASESVVAPTGITVRDSIEMTRLLDPTPVIDADQSAGAIKFSPKRTHFAIVTRKDSVDRDTVTANILVFNVESVRDFLNSESPINTNLASTVVTMKSTPINVGLDRPVGISHLRWLSDSTIAFIGQRGVRPAQVYIADVLTRQLTQVTDHDRHVKQYDVSAQSEVLVYVAEDEGFDHTESNLRGYAVGSRLIYETLLRDSSTTDVRDEAYFSLNLSSRKVKRLTSPGHPLVSWPGLWVSPDGRWVVSLANVGDVPAAWLAEYAPLGEIGKINKKFEGNPALSPQAKNIRQYVLIDTSTGSTRPLLRAPVSWGNKTVHWSLDSASVIVTNSFLPLESTDDKVLERRRNGPFIVDVQTATGRFSPIASHASIGGELRATKNPEDGVLVTEYTQQDRKETATSLYRRSQTTGEWVLNERDAVPTTKELISVFIAQDVNTPPDIAATDFITNQTKLITNLNPTLSDRLGAPVEALEWTDINGRVWVGGILYPPDYQPNKRYPLVIQTYGYFPEEFLIDGPIGIRSAYAARPLSSQGIVVLQMHYSPLVGDHPKGAEEGPGFVAAFEEAVHTLEERGTIDLSRVGIVGFSREGLHVSYAVAFSEIAFAAATIADATGDGLGAHMQFFGAPPPGVFEQESAMGSPFWGQGRLLWLDRSPNMNGHRIRTPLRFEQYGFGIGGYWDLYTLLRRHFRPAEVFHIPFAVHNLQRPLAIYASQQGNVDWFAFWLKGYEDSDPDKVQQYERWRTMRDQYCSRLNEERASEFPWYCARVES